MNARFPLTTLFILLLFTSAGAQHKDAIALEAKIKEVVSRCAPATVLVSRYDSIGARTSGGSFSGVVVSEDGIVLTAGHVSSPNEMYQIDFPDGRQVMAKGLGRIKQFDLGVMRIIDQGKYPYAEMGWSSSLKENEPCISIA